MNKILFQKKSLFLMTAICFIICTMYVFLTISFYHRIPLSHLIQFIIQDHFYENYNILNPFYIANVNFYIYVYLIILLSIILTFCLAIVFKNKLFKQEHTLLTPIILFVTLNAFIMLKIIETAWLIQSFEKEFYTMTDKNIDERNANIIGHDFYQFIQFCKQNLNGKYNAQLLTDLDISEAHGKFVLRILGYYLYPIDIRGIRGKPTDCLIVFSKREAIKAVPEDFHILAVFDEQNLIAIKKGP